MKRRSTKYIPPESKGKVGLEALKGVKTINEIGQEYNVHPVQVSQWKKAIQKEAKCLFEGKRGPKPVALHQQPEHLYSEIGKLKMELDWLKKVRDQPAVIRQSWVSPTEALSVVRQCELTAVTRSTVYAHRHPVIIDEHQRLLCRLMDVEYTRRPFYGSRRMVVYLKKVGHAVNRKRIQRLMRQMRQMRQMGLAGMAPGSNTSRAHPEYRIYPYLLRGVAVVRPQQVWSTAITYIRLERGFVYLVAIIDWYSRKVLSWRLSNSMDAAFCVDCLEETLLGHGRPEIFNSDQGSQFTGTIFTDVLKCEELAISMDGRGRALDKFSSSGYGKQ